MPAEVKALKLQSGFQDPRFLVQDVLLLLPVLMFPFYLIYFAFRIIPAWRYVHGQGEERTALRVLTLPLVALACTTVLLLSYYVVHERILVQTSFPTI